MNRIEISEGALEDLNDGFLFYEVQEPGLGDYFVACLRADIERLKIAAGTHRIAYRDYHHMVSKVFPYGIYYTIVEKTATVWAVLDLRRDPKWILDQLDE